MAVYTDITDEELSGLLADYDLGAARSFKGIAEGIENSNFLLETATGRYFLTVYEKRVDPADLPFFLGLMQHLAQHGFPCATPIADREGRLLKSLRGKPCALVSYLSGLSVRRPSAAHCREAGMSLAWLHQAGVTNLVDDLSLMRGFDYYTDIVFEVFDTDPDNNRSMFGGGRYDGLVGLFGVEPVPTVGFGMGDVTLLNFLKAHSLLKDPKPETDVVAILIGDVYEAAQPILSGLRAAGINLAVDSSGRKLDTQLKHAVRSKTKFVLFIGEAEINGAELKLRDLDQNQEKQLSLEQVAETLSAARG